MSALDDSFGSGHNDITLLVQSRQAKQKMEFRIKQSKYSTEGGGVDGGEGRGREV